MKRKCRGLEITSSGHADRRASGHAPFGTRAVVHRLVKGTLHSRGLVAGRYQPLADDDTLIRVARPCLAFCSRIRKRSETVPVGIASLRSRIEAAAAPDGLVTVNRRAPPAIHVYLASRINVSRCDSSAANPTELGFAGHLTSTLAPASSSFFLAASASAFDTPSLTGFGAPSTRSF